MELWKTYEVWCEGYVATGESGGHHLLGKVRAKDFKDACHRLLKDNKTYDAERNTLWGCSLFDNAADAAKSFG